MERKCVVCGKEFHRPKTNKKTCSDKCRTQLARYRIQVKEKYWRIKEDVEVYEKMLKIEELHDDAHKHLEAILIKIYKALGMDK